MKILLTTDTVGGVWTYALDLAAALGPAGVRIALATMGNPVSADQRQQVGQLPHVTLFESTFKLEWMPDCWADVQAAGEWLLQVAGAFGAELVHLNGYAHGTLPWGVPVLMVAHSCVLSWWEAVKGEAAPGEWAAYRATVRAGLRAADLVVAPTAAMLAEAERLYGPFRQARVIANGRDASCYRVGVKEPFILCAGRLWDEAKNLAALDAIAGELAWPVYVAGEQAAFGSTTAATAVRPLGRLNEPTLADWMARASLYVLPARYEPFGLSALEAALSGCALVLGDIASLREVWGEAAVYVRPTDRQGLRRAIAELIESPERRGQLATLAREHAKRYTREAMGEAYRKAYRELLKR